MKKVVFFDGDGTLWYPKSTKRTQKPHWVYLDKSISDPIAEFIVTPQTVETLRELGARGIKRVLLSTSPLPEDEAILHRIEVVNRLQLRGLLDDIRVAPDYRDGKGERALQLLKEYGFSKKDALLIGDMYNWDYKPAQDVGIDALLIDSDYERDYAKSMGVTDFVTDISGILPFLGIKRPAIWRG